MLKYAAMAVGAALLVALVFVFLPVANGPRPEPRILSAGDPPAPTSFTIHDAPPVPAAPSALPPPPTPGDLDAVMQRLRNASAQPGQPVPGPATAPPLDLTATVSPPVTPPVATPVAPPDPVPPPPARWGSVTGSGTRWRMARSGSGYTVSIDLGGGRVADVHVLPAFANLDPASVNVRVDYLRDTILQNFSSQSGTYSFARDGSVSIER